MTRTTHSPGAGRLLLSLAAIGITIGMAAPAQAQGFISPLIGYDFGGDSGCPDLQNCEDKKVNASVSVGAMGNVLGVEAEVAYAPNFFGDVPGLSSNVLTVMGNLMLVPKLGPVRPYALVGIGLLKTHVELTAASAIQSDSNNMGWDVGGGLMVFFGDHVGLRADLRYFQALQDFSVLGFQLNNARLTYGRAGAGLVLKF